MTKTVTVDTDKIDQALDELAKLILRLNKKPKKDTRLIKKITEIRDSIQDAIVRAKLKKSFGNPSKYS
jgi:hypothetical protein